MDENKLETIFAQNNQKEYIKIIKRALDKIDPSSTQELKDKIENDKSYNDQIRAQIVGQPKQITWTHAENRLNRNDVEEIWLQMDRDNTRVKKSELYKLCSEYDGEHTRGLKKNMTDREIENLIRQNDGKEMDPLATFKRKRFDEEKRCVQKRNGEVNWYSTLEAIKKLTKSARYTKDMIHETILDISKELLPDYHGYHRSLTLEELTEHLIEQDPIEYEESLHLRPLKKLTRKVDVPLHTITKNAEKLYKLYIKKPNASSDEQSANFDQSVKQFNIDTLVKLTAQPVSKTILKHIHKCKTNGTSYTYTNLLHGAIQMEEASAENRPSTELELKFMTLDELSVNLNNININKQDDSDSDYDTPHNYITLRKLD